MFSFFAWDVDVENRYREVNEQRMKSRSEQELLYFNCTKYSYLHFKTKKIPWNHCSNGDKGATQLLEGNLGKDALSMYVWPKETLKKCRQKRIKPWSFLCASDPTFFSVRVSLSSLHCTYIHMYEYIIISKHTQIYVNIYNTNFCFSMFTSSHLGSICSLSYM